MKDLELKPCPFCGAEAELVEHRGWSISKFSVRCSGYDCEIEPETSLYCEKEEAVEAWNRRCTDVQT